MNKQALVLVLLVLFCWSRILGGEGENNIVQENVPPTDKEVKPEETIPQEVKLDVVQAPDVTSENVKSGEVKPDEVKTGDDKSKEGKNEGAQKNPDSKSHNHEINGQNNDCIDLFGHHFEKKRFRIYLIAGLGILMFGGIVAAFCLGRKKD